MESQIRATVAASRKEIEQVLSEHSEGSLIEVLETDGFDGETLSIILTSAALVEGIRSLRLVLIAFLAKQRRIRISQGETEIEVSSAKDLALILDRLARPVDEA